MKIFIGTEPNQRLACEVLKYSILRRASAPVEFTEIGRDLGLPMQTGFSFARWEVPHLCGYEGRAVYMDADIVVLGDVAELEAMPMDTGALARPTADDRYFTSVMVLDCARLMRWDFAALVEQAKTVPWKYASTMWAAKLSAVRDDFSPLPRRWNDLDRTKEDTAAIHYTDLKRQPWRFRGHPYSNAFCDTLKSAISDGFIPDRLVRDEVGKGHIRADVLIVA